MLWLSALMGLLAVGAFTLLWFLPVRRREEDTVTEDLADDTNPELTDHLAETVDDAVDAGSEFGAEFGDESLEDQLDAEIAALQALDDGEDRPLETLDEHDSLDFALSREDTADGDEEMDVTEDEAELAMALQDTASEEDDWFSAGHGTTDFDDFDPEEDDLVVVWDDALGSVPSVQIVRNEDDPAVARVLLGDTILAQFRTRADASYDEVSLVPLSTARSLGWAHP